MSVVNKTMDGKICLVTGASSGIGKVTALELARAGATVVMVSRDSGRGEAARREIQQQSGNPSVDLLLTDLSSQQEVRQLAEQFKQKYSQLHVLINNAGGVFAQKRLSRDGIEMTFAVNHLAGFLLTNLLLDTLNASTPARIINVSSMAQARGFINLDDLQFEHSKYRLMQAYGQSKLGNVLFTYELARRLEGTGITANCLHPGVVATNIWSQPLPPFLRALGGVSRFFGISPEQGAQTTLYLAMSPEVEGVSGKYFDQCQERPTTRISYDQALQQRFWDISAELTGLTVKA